MGFITAQSDRRTTFPGVAAPLASAGCRGNCLRMVDGRLGKIVLPTFIYIRLCFYESPCERPAPRGGCWSALLEGKKQRVVNIVTVAWLATAGLRGGQILEASSSTCSASHTFLPSASAALPVFKSV